MFGEMAVLIHVHPRLVLHGDEFKVRVALRALVVRMHQALGGHDYLRRVAIIESSFNALAAATKHQDGVLTLHAAADPCVESGVRR